MKDTLQAQYLLHESERYNALVVFFVCFLFIHISNSFFIFHMFLYRLPDAVPMVQFIKLCHTTCEAVCVIC